VAEDPAEQLFRPGRNGRQHLRFQLDFGTWRAPHFTFTLTGRPDDREINVSLVPGSSRKAGVHLRSGSAAIQTQGADDLQLRLLGRGPIEDFWQLADLLWRGRTHDHGIGLLIIPDWKPYADWENETLVIRVADLEGQLQRAKIMPYHQLRRWVRGNPRSAFLAVGPRQREVIIGLSMNGFVFGLALPGIKKHPLLERTGYWKHLLKPMFDELRDLNATGQTRPLLDHMGRVAPDRLKAYAESLQALREYHAPALPEPD
jgi:hypothetical protein